MKGLKKMYRVILYRDNIQIDEFTDDLMSRAVDRATKRGEAGDLMYVWDVIQTADGQYEEIGCDLRVTL